MLFGSFIRACDLENKPTENFFLSRYEFKLEITEYNVQSLTPQNSFAVRTLTFLQKFYTYWNFLALSIIVDVDMRIFWISTAWILRIAKATLLMNLTVTCPCFITICANFTTWIIFFWAFRYTDTFSWIIIHLTNTTSLTVDLCTWIV